MKKVKSTKYSELDVISSSANEPLVGYGALISTNFTKINSIKNGISTSEVERVRVAFGLTQLALADILHMNPKTLRTKIAESGKIDPLHGSMIAALGELSAKGNSVFEDQDKFIQWLNFPSPALGDKMPLHFLDTYQGIRLIYSELESIEEGSFA